MRIRAVPSDLNEYLIELPKYRAENLVKHTFMKRCKRCFYWWHCELLLDSFLYSHIITLVTYYLSSTVWWLFCEVLWDVCDITLNNKYYYYYAAKNSGKSVLNRTFDRCIRTIPPHFALGSFIIFATDSRMSLMKESAKPATVMGIVTHRWKLKFITNGDSQRWICVFLLFLIWESWKFGDWLDKPEESE